MFNGTKICGLYRKKSERSGKTYLTGRVNAGARLLILSNTKQGEGEPDYTAWLVPVEADASATKGTDQASGAASGYRPNGARSNQWQRPTNAGARPPAPQSPPARPVEPPASVPDDDL